ncbi:MULTISPECIES: energy transducer TonB [unclassified Pseudoalteromonas]|uniref:energy transducer TonB n=1 Tax=unclassified Pseudoalteromonas TaxID=194690 RepID=UPI002098358C|nr:energy transducer TonB [Pseudoalteromonas sp. XMcav2-N]MCO7188093.1 energy transducer TonB [Pseudoalteromonas sp. XMcav2-N]
MSLLAGPSYAQHTQQRRKWVFAIAAALILHLFIALALLWHAPTKLIPPPASSPKTFEVSIVSASTQVQNQELQGPQQEESKAVQPTQTEPQPEVQPQPDTQVKPNESAESPVKLAKPKEKPKEQKQPDTKPAPKPPKKALSKVQKEPEPAKPDTPRDTQSSHNSAKSSPASAQAQASQNTSAKQQGTQNNSHMQAEMQWRGQVQAHLERKKRYPRSAKIRAQQGAPWVKFSIDRQGNVLSVSLYRASGIAALDDEAVALVNRAAPLPVPPGSVEGNPITMAVPIAFFIKK